jgi:anhydro-N-acetylmuramic acid kinase
MSGTSLDGLDIAACSISGSGIHTEAELLHFETHPYPKDLKEHLKNIASVPTVSLEEVCLMHSRLGNYHGELILASLEKWGIPPSDVDCIASHGQTIYHAPKNQHLQEEMPNATLQIGDGDHIARATGILTISDFRQKHTAAGGEGAPMASFTDRLLYTHETQNRILLNIGGIANFTFLPARNNTNRHPITADTGPGNTLIDAAMQKLFKKEFDQDGAIAAEGAVVTEALKVLKSDPYFRRPVPKTTGPEVFNLKWVYNQFETAGIGEIDPKSFVATLTRLTAETIADSILNAVNLAEHPVIYASGGGVHNLTLFGWLKDLLPDLSFRGFEHIGPKPDAKEAFLFAILANEMLSGQGFVLATNRSEKVNFGKISFPE